ncbi:703_t:CDS:2 [Diversispora eburnea]|uniref:703_t:CDS:1 n=1 Tax=Diversispora eburnea TaxID=1213867 RepID=A0A9N8VMF3_9GLOM|nr:703_t:CDS:2 [Diversispora eburnea]
MSFYPVICLSASKMVIDSGEKGMERRDGFLYIQGSADDHEMWSMGLTSSQFWKYQKEILDTNDPIECEKRVKEIVTREKINNYNIEEKIITKDSFENTFFNFIGNSNIAIGNYKRKKGQNKLFSSIPIALEFVKKPLEEKKRILIHCKVGIDRSVGICLAILINYFDDEVVTKDLIQKRLLLITKYRIKANPTRATLKKVNNYFMSNLQ